MESCNATCPPQVGIYVHVPFCAQGKCPYCDFYSVKMSGEVGREVGCEVQERYIESVERDLQARAKDACSREINTVYFGGGTPSLLGEGLARLLFCVAENYKIEKGAEITFEANPKTIDYDTLLLLRKSGFNRISLGMQSAVQKELDALGRRHTKEDVKIAVENAKKAGFDNISLDLMLCVPGQTQKSMRESVDFAASLSPRHISAYILKVEKGTRYFDIKDTLNLPDDDAQADMYLAACEAIEEKGYNQYEISNFAEAGFESQHNLRYWNCDEYLGFGPAAHSFFAGRRFYYPRGLEEYIAGNPPVQDGDGGSLKEYIMLRLRLSTGIEDAEMKRRFGVGLSFFDKGVIGSLEKSGLIKYLPKRLSLTKKGFLVSNSIISELIFR